MAGHVGVETPAGWSFWEKPYRHYQYRGKKVTPNGLEILSVTQALGIIDKSTPLQHYAARMTLEGCSTVLREFGLVKGTNGHLPEEVDLEDLCMIADDPQYLNTQLKRRGLTFYSRTDAAAQRGTALHTVLEDWIDHERLPDPSKHAPERRGYVQSLAAWLAAERPTFEESELIVGSTEHGFAGARDTVLVMRDPKRGRALVDLKTSKAVYPSSHFRQITAYDRAGVMCGAEPTDSQGILRINADGSIGTTTWLQDFGTPEFFWTGFLNALACARDERAINSRAKAMEREAKAAA